FTQFAVADVDADGALEVIVKIMTDGYEYGYEILKDRAGTIYGYDLVLRAFQDPKADGTASYASSAFETGFGTLVFGETLCSYNAIAYSEADATGAVRYYANGAALSADAFDQLLTEQAGKPSVAWYDLTDDNLARILGA
ncbi:MAG: hypothetical protein PHY12_11005, partial [Eubacteriales bacterium]|nr:hypothetical protein [Eubacteriales bacterium]